MTTAGAGGSLTGRGADLLIIDDAHKNAEEAYSKVHRERIWEWWTTTALTRLEPGGAVIVVGTRWHEDDLIGRILAQEGEPWRAIRLAALADDDDPLGRPAGAALWPERYDEAALHRIRASVGERAWEGLYQQRPFGDGSSFFKREWLQHRYDTVAPGVYVLPDGHRVKLADLNRFATVDLAVSIKTTADYSVIGTFGALSDGRLLVLGIDRARREGPDLIPAVKRATALWSTTVVWIEKTGFQLSIVQEARRKGVCTRELVADKDKASRALPATAAFEGGRILLPRTAPWLEAFESEVLGFPNGAHDDQVDVLAYAVAVQASHNHTLRIATASPRPPAICRRPRIWDGDPFVDRSGPGGIRRMRLW